MSALPTLLTGEGAHARARSVLEGIELRQLGVRPDVAPHSIYEELWHLVWWQDFILAEAQGAKRQSPAHASETWPSKPAPDDVAEARELVRRFLAGLNQAIALASSAETLDKQVGKYTVRSLLETLLAHNSYHLGKIVLLRQLIGIWPPPSGGDTW
ncbi:DinB family protein [soil metagenome]